MLFLNNEHHDNFFIIQSTIPKVEKDREYRSTAYILALPAIYDAYGSMLKEFVYPTFWMYEHLKNIDNSEMAEDIFQLGLLSLHLWNEDDRFDLMTCMKKVDKQLFAICMNAINIRKGADLVILM